MTEIMPTNEQLPPTPEPITRTVRVTIEKEIRIYLSPDMALPETIAEWCKYLWDIESIDDIAKFAASMAAQFGGGHSFDGIGRLGPSYSTYPSVPDTKFDELSSNVETEIVDIEPQGSTSA